MGNRLERINIRIRLSADVLLNVLRIDKKQVFPALHKAFWAFAAWRFNRNHGKFFKIDMRQFFIREDRLNTSRTQASAFLYGP